MTDSKIFDRTNHICGLHVVEETLHTLSGSPGVYRMLGTRGEVLYIGKAKNLKKRVRSYTQVDKLPLRLQRMVSETARMEIIVTHTEIEALLLEANLIQKLHPKYNIVFKDNRSMAYIFLSEETYPVLRKHRGPRTQKGDYFGPFPSVQDVTSTLSSLHRAFLLRSCSDRVFQTRNRPCLQYYIKRCSAPCVDLISENDYKILVGNARSALAGQSTQVQADLASEMQRLSQDQAYEQAAILRDRIRALTQLQSRQTIFSASVENGDVVALAQASNLTCLQMFFFRNGGNYGTKVFLLPAHETQGEDPSAILEACLLQFYQTVTPPPLILLSQPPAHLKLLTEALSTQAGFPVTIEVSPLGETQALIKHALQNAEQALARALAQRESQAKALQRLSNFLNLPQQPNRIEIYDNSHSSGKEAYGVMVVADSEGFVKKQYRQFKISDAVTPGDDYGMMTEVFERRFRPSGDHPVLPDLIVVDGGAGQLSVCADVLQRYQLSIPLLAVSKGPERNAGRETLHRMGCAPCQLPPDDPLLYYIQRLRDEAHRFAIATHGHRKQKGSRKSTLDQIPGIGPKRKANLLKHFGSVASLARAGIKDMVAVEGIPEALAEKIYSYFQNHH